MNVSDEEGHEIVSKIGEGNSSIAYKVIDHQHKQVLCKKVLKEKEYETVFPEFQKKMKEIKVLNQDRHPSIYEVIGVNIQGRHESQSENENENIKIELKGLHDFHSIFCFHYHEIVLLRAYFHMYKRNYFDIIIFYQFFMKILAVDFSG